MFDSLSEEKKADSQVSNLKADDSIPDLLREMGCLLTETASRRSDRNENESSHSGILHRQHGNKSCFLVYTE